MRLKTGSASKKLLKKLARLMGTLQDGVKQDPAITVLQAEVERLRERTQCR